MNRVKEEIDTAIGDFIADLLEYGKRGGAIDNKTISVPVDPLWSPTTRARYLRRARKILRKFSPTAQIELTEWSKEEMREGKPC